MLIYFFIVHLTNLSPAKRYAMNLNKTLQAGKLNSYKFPMINLSIQNDDLQKSIHTNYTNKKLVKLVRNWFIAYKIISLNLAADIRVLLVSDL